MVLVRVLSWCFCIATAISGYDSEYCNTSSPLHSSLTDTMTIAVYSWLRYLIIPLLGLLVAVIARDELFGPAIERAPTIRHEKPQTATLRHTSRMQRVRARLLLLVAKLLFFLPTSATVVPQPETTDDANSDAPSLSPSSDTCNTDKCHHSSCSHSQSDTIRIALAAESETVEFEISTNRPLSHVVALYQQHNAKSSPKHSRALSPKQTSSKTTLSNGQISASATAESDVNAYLLRFVGRVLPLNETPERLGLRDLSIIDIEIDYHHVFDVVRHRIDDIRQSIENELSIERSALSDSEKAIAACDESIALFEQQSNDAQDKIKSLNADHNKIKAEIDRIQREIDAQNEATASIESSMGSVDDRERASRAARASLEQQLTQIRQDVVTIHSTLLTTRQQHTRASKERSDLKERLRELTIKLESTERERLEWKNKSNRALLLTEKMEKLNMTITEVTSSVPLVTLRQRIELMDKEIQVILSERSIHIERMKELNEIETELNLNKTKLKNIEKDNKEYLRLKNLILNLEQDITEINRWKLYLQQSTTRQQSFERSLRELNQWKIRAKTMEKQVKMLRSWKRTVMQRATEQGLTLNMEQYNALRDSGYGESQSQSQSPPSSAYSSSALFNDNFSLNAPFYPSMNPSQNHAEMDGAHSDDAIEPLTDNRSDGSSRWNSDCVTFDNDSAVRTDVTTDHVPFHPLNGLDALFSQQKRLSHPPLAANDNANTHPFIERAKSLQSDTHSTSFYPLSSWSSTPSSLLIIDDGDTHHQPQHVGNDVTVDEYDNGDVAIPLAQSTRVRSHPTSMSHPPGFRPRNKSDITFPHPSSSHNSSYPNGMNGGRFASPLLVDYHRSGHVSSGSVGDHYDSLSFRDDLSETSVASSGISSTLPLSPHSSGESAHSNESTVNDAS